MLPRVKVAWVSCPVRSSKNPYDEPNRRNRQGYRIGCEKPHKPATNGVPATTIRWGASSSADSNDAHWHKNERPDGFYKLHPEQKTDDAEDQKGTETK